MAKPKGATSFASISIAELEVALGGNRNIPVRVSKVWLASVRNVFGGEEGKVVTENDPSTPASEPKAGVTVVDDD